MYKKVVKILLLFTGLVVFLLMTNPGKISAIYLLVPILWLFGALYYTIITVLQAVISGNNTLNLKLNALIMALIPTCLLLLNSISQLTARDTIIVLLFGIGSIFYVSKFKITS